LQRQELIFLKNNLIQWLVKVFSPQLFLMKGMAKEDKKKERTEIKHF